MKKVSTKKENIIMKKEKNKFTMKRDRLLLNNKKNWINQNKTLNNILKNNRFLFFRFGH
jgi:hypothetical protein